jgi:hypothetical protein
MNTQDAFRVAAMKRPALLLVAFALAVPAAARADVETIPVAGNGGFGARYGTDFTLVPGGLAVATSDGDTLTVTKIDATSSARTQLASIPGVRNDHEWAVGADADAVAVASHTSVFAGPLGAPSTHLSSCVGATALDVSRLAYLAQPHCDLVVRDLADLTDSVVSSGLVFDHVILSFPFSAVSYDDG